PAPCISTAELIRTIQTCQLLEPSRLAPLAENLSRFPDARALARELLQRGWLTPFQVNRLLLGRGSGLIIDQYLLLERLGEGGVGQVFKAVHQKLKRLVALKVIRKDLLTDADMVSRFYREIKVLSQLNHPNIVHAYDAGLAGTTHFLVMEYVEG